MTKTARDPAFATALSLLSRMVEAIEERAPYSAGHSSRVADLAFAVGGRLGLDARALDLLQVAGHAHDVGMLLVPDEVLWQPGPLGLAGREALKRHVEVGARIVSGVPVLAECAAWIRTHHERWDGNGYPSGLRGEEIPLGGRILGACEAYVGMTSDRPHRRAIEKMDVLRSIRDDAGRAFAPDVVAALLHVLGA